MIDTDLDGLISRADLDGLVRLVDATVRGVLIECLSSQPCVEVPEGRL